MQPPRKPITASDQSVIRDGYTLLELIGAMTAATVMLLVLGTSISVSTSLVEPTDEDGTLTRDRAIADRLSNDLRYATSIKTQSGYGIEVARPDLQDASINLNYEAYLDGLVRQVSGGGAVTLDPVTPTVTHYVDGYSAPTAAASLHAPRVVGVSSAVTDGTAANTVSIDVPTGAVPGDLLVLVSSYRNSPFLTPSTSGWRSVESQRNVDVVIQVHFRVMSISTPITHSLSVLPGADAAIAMLGIEDAQSGSPFGWTGTGIGSAIMGNSSTYPVPLQNPGAIGASSLQLQFFGQSGSPWPQHTLGIASFADCIQLTGSSGTDGEVSLGVAMRNGAMPALTNSSRVWQAQSGNWVSAAAQIEGSY